MNSWEPQSWNQDRLEIKKILKLDQIAPYLIILLFLLRILLRILLKLKNKSRNLNFKGQFNLLIFVSQNYAFVKLIHFCHFIDLQSYPNLSKFTQELDNWIHRGNEVQLFVLLVPSLERAHTNNKQIEESQWSLHSFYCDLLAAALKNKKLPHIISKIIVDYMVIKMSSN